MNFESSQEKDLNFLQKYPWKQNNTAIGSLAGQNRGGAPVGLAGRISAREDH